MGGTVVIHLFRSINVHKKGSVKIGQCPKGISILFLQLAREFKKLMWDEVSELGQVRVWLVRGTADGRRVSAALPKFRWSVAKHKGNTLTTAPHYFHGLFYLKG